jgi:hypothetical protein
MVIQITGRDFDIGRIERLKQVEATLIEDAGRTAYSLGPSVCED